MQYNFARAVFDADIAAIAVATAVVVATGSIITVVTASVATGVICCYSYR